MSYDMIDRFLRNNLGDDDYAEYSAALDSLCAPSKREWVGLTDEEIKPLCGHPWVFETVKQWVQIIEAKLKEKNT